MEDKDLIPALDAKHQPFMDDELEGIPDNPSFWWKLIHLDPVLVRGFVMSTAALLGGLGLALNDVKMGAILGFVSALMLLGQALWTRRAVVPNAKVVVYKPDPVNEPNLLEAGPAVSTDVVQVANAAADTPVGTRAVTLLPFPERVENE